MNQQDTLIELRNALRSFAEARDWQQFHTAKNLVMALSGEVGEVTEHFQWLTPEASMTLDDGTRADVALELADVLLYLIRLADVLDIDLGDAARNKLVSNALRYPVDKAYGKADKYDRL
jgi:dCTP diphosphatase